MAYTVVDWLVSNESGLDGGVLSKKEDARRALFNSVRNDADLRRVSRFIDKGGFNGVSSISGKSINSEINRRNEEWTQTLLSDISNAQSNEDLGSIKLTLDSQGSSFEDESVSTIEQAISQRASQIEVQVQQVAVVEEISDDFESTFDQALSQARSAETADEVDTGIELPMSMGEIRRKYGAQVASDISARVAEVGDQLFDIKQSKRE